MTHRVTSRPQRCQPIRLCLSLIYSRCQHVFCTKCMFARYSICTVHLTLCIYICLFCDVGKKCSMEVFQEHGRKDSVVCQVCLQTIKNEGSNTSNLLRHLQKRHAVQYATINMNKCKTSSASGKKDISVAADSSTSSQPSITSTFARATPLTPGNQHYEMITNAITHFLCKDNIPFNTVNRPSFQRLLNVLESRYQIPNKTTFYKSKVVKL